MKYYLLAIFIVACQLAVFSPGSVNGQCADENPDKLYDRVEILNQLIGILNSSVPDYDPIPPGFYIIKRSGNVGGFFIYDLSDPSNSDTAMTHECINFIDGHIYHFAPGQDQYSASHILILEKGKLKVFKSINCSNSEDQLKDVIAYLEQKLKDAKDKDEILFRVRHYRRYGDYVPSHIPNYYCKNAKIINTTGYVVEPEDLFKGKNVLREFSNILERSIPEYRKYFNNGFFANEGRAMGFSVFDLTDPRNRQSSDDEHVYFVKNHIYHFAPIDLPWSFSFIAILGESDIKVFRAINCKNKGDRLKDVLKFLKVTLKNSSNKTEILTRVKNYRKYGVYAPFNGISEPQCKYLELNNDESPE